MLTNRKTQRKLDKASTTTRNTTRVRAPKGFADDLRYRALKSVPHERLESLLQKRLQRIHMVLRHAVYHPPFGAPNCIANEGAATCLRYPVSVVQLTCFGR